MSGKNRTFLIESGGFPEMSEKNRTFLIESRGFPEMSEKNSFFLYLFAVVVKLELFGWQRW